MPKPSDFAITPMRAVEGQYNEWGNIVAAKPKMQERFDGLEATAWQAPILLVHNLVLRSTLTFPSLDAIAAVTR